MTLTVKKTGFFGLARLGPGRQGLPNLLAQIHHSAGRLLLPLIDLHRTLVERALFCRFFNTNWLCTDRQDGYASVAIFQISVTY
jgi:hypothetical protein